MVSKNKTKIFSLVMLLCVSIISCNNPIMEKWWGEPIDNPQPDPGGRGENFGVVVFDTGGGTPQPRALNIAWNSAVGRLRPVSRENFGFIGWFDENGNRWDVETRLVEEDDDKDEDGFITLTARWSTTTCTVKFVTNDPATIIEDQIVGSGGRIIQPVNPLQRKDGYGFAGWYEDNKFEGEPWNFAHGIVTSNITLYARWDPNVRTVLFVANGGTRPDGSEMTRIHFAVPLGGYIQDPGALVRVGHSFGGWCPNPLCLTDTACTDACKWNFTNDTMEAGADIFYLYAKWVHNIYFINFITTPSTVTVPDQSILHGSIITQPADLPQLDDGRYFAGWFTEDTYINQWNFMFGTVTGNMTLYARWLTQVPDPDPEPIPGGSGDNFGVVVFDTDGGIPQPRAVKIAWGNTVGRLRPMSRGNDGFIGWFDENGNPWDVETREVQEENDVDGDGFITLTARWLPFTPDAVIHTVNFEAVPGDPPIIIPLQKIAHDGNAVQPVNPERYGYGFSGWHSDIELNYLWDFANYAVVNDMTLYAKWESNFRTVTFEANDGTRPDGATELTPTQRVPIGYLVQDPGPLVKEGHSFGGWYNNAGLSGEQWDFANNTVTVDMTLYAKWVLNEYIVKFITIPSSTNIDDRRVTHGSTVTPPVNPQVGDGRAFGGWFTEDVYLNQWDFDIPITSNITLYARWVNQTRTVVFKVNGGNEMPRTQFTILINPVTGSTIISPGNASRTGHIFTGWFTDPDCTPASRWNFSTDRIRETDVIIGIDPMYLYAGWRPNTYTVTFNIDVEPLLDTAARTQRVDYGERVERPIAPENPGKFLNGWYTDTGYTNLWNFDTNTVTSNRTLYAKWEEADYFVRFHLGDHPGIPSSFEAPAEQHYRFDNTITEPFMPALPADDKTSWSFYGWYASKDPTTPPATINNGSLSSVQRNSYLSDNPWDFNTPLNDGNTVTTQEGDTRVLNLYARWVPPEPDMVWVPRGSFVMGDTSVSGSPAAYHAYPTRHVTVDGFYISRYEVTQVNSPDSSRGYQQIMGVNPGQFSKNTLRPIERVSWYDAIQYCIRLTDLTPGLDQVYTIGGITTTPISGTGTPGIPSITNATVTVRNNTDNPGYWNNGFRLPTEAEWEFAARGGNGSPGNFTYAGSNNSTEVAWYNETVKTEPAGQQSTQIVGSKKANALGIYDMSGNVSEWVWDWFVSYKDPYYSTDAASINPTGPAFGTERVRRGGGWSNAVGNVRSVVRNSDTPDTAHWVVGFRVVRGASEIW